LRRRDREAPALGPGQCGRGAGLKSQACRHGPLSSGPGKRIFFRDDLAWRSRTAAGRRGRRMTLDEHRRKVAALTPKAAKIALRLFDRDPDIPVEWIIVLRPLLVERSTAA